MILNAIYFYMGGAMATMLVIFIRFRFGVGTSKLSEDPNWIDIKEKLGGFVTWVTLILFLGVASLLWPAYWALWIWSKRISAR